MKRVKFLFVLFIVVALISSAWMLHYATTSLKLSPQSQEIDIRPNSSLKSIANQLVAQNVIQDALPFIILAKVLQRESMLQAGHYTLNRNVTPYQLMLSLNHGKATQGGITFIEGKTFKDMRLKIAKNKALKQTIKGMSDEAVLKLLDIKEKHPEGLFFPDTYYFDRNTPDVVILKKAYTSMQDKLNKAWQTRADGLPYKNQYEALIMASIIEKETGRSEERKMIAGVFINRLRIGMRLQTDPTVIYGMGDAYHGNIRKKDLQRDTLYNTYTRSGLPPTPIAMPGYAAIQAALHPASTKALYFVGKGDGSHAFSATLSEHNRAVVQYQLKK